MAQDDFDYLTNILLVAAKKTLTRKWLSQECPALNICMEITMDMYKMEKVPAFLNQKLEQCTPRWENVTEKKDLLVHSCSHCSYVNLR